MIPPFIIYDTNTICDRNPFLVWASYWVKNSHQPRVYSRISHPRKFKHHLDVELDNNVHIKLLGHIFQKRFALPQLSEIHLEYCAMVL